MAATVRLIHPTEDPSIRQFFEALVQKRLDECEKLLAQVSSLLRTDAIGLRVLKQAAFEGNLPVCKWAIKHLAITEEAALTAFECAAAFGHSGLCEWFLNNTSYITNRAVNKGFLRAAQRGQFACCKWLRENTLSITDETIAKGARTASERGHGDLLKYLNPPKSSLQAIGAAYAS